MTATSLRLNGLDASNPLAYMAALGLLQVLDDSSAKSNTPTNWRLSWIDDGRWVAMLHGPADAQTLIALLHADLMSWRGEFALQLAYDDDGMHLPSDSIKATFDLKPKPSTFRTFIDKVAETCTVGHMRSARLAAAYGSELIADNKGNLKPTALHFTAGQQTFLGMVRTLQESLMPEDFQEALFGPWRNTSRLPSLSWNASAPRVYAYRADNPSGEKRGSVPAADWLAFVGLRFFPVASHGKQRRTTGIEGGWKDSTMRWAVWDAPLSLNAVRSLQNWRELRNNAAREKWASAGITAVYESRILRSDQGGYGSFSPARVL